MRNEKQNREVESEERIYRCVKIRRKKIYVRENQKKEDMAAQRLGKLRNALFFQ